MTLRLGVVMDPIAGICYQKDTSLALLLKAQERGWQLYYMEQSDLYQEEGVAMGAMAPLTVYDSAQRWFALEHKEDAPLASLDAILMRKDPPFDNEYIYSTYMLEQAEREGTVVVNRPASLRDCNEKYFATLFPNYTTPTLVSRDMARLKGFAQRYEDVIYKPLDGMGGAGVLRVKRDDANLSVILEMLTSHGRTQIVAQRFIGEVSKGDKRILMIDGEPVPYALVRIPQSGELRGNLAAGGRGVVAPLSARDREIAACVGPELQKRGLIFVGLDVIGDYLTEINVTSPTCLRQIEGESGYVITDKVLDVIERRCTRERTSIEPEATDITPSHGSADRG